MIGEDGEEEGVILQNQPGRGRDSTGIAIGRCPFLNASIEVPGGVDENRGTYEQETQSRYLERCG